MKCKKLAVFAVLSTSAVGTFALANPVAYAATQTPSAVSQAPVPSMVPTSPTAPSQATQGTNLNVRSSSYAQVLQLVSQTSLTSKVPTTQVVDIAKEFRAIEAKRAEVKAEEEAQQQAEQQQAEYNSMFDPNDHSYFTGQQALNSVQYFMPIIEHYAYQYGISPSLVASIMLSESGGNPYATSNAQAYGLMQLDSNTFSQYSPQDLFHPELNIQLGTSYLASLSAQYGGNVQLIAAAYNAGPKAVERYGGIPPYQQTQEYVAHVTSAMNGF